MNQNLKARLSSELIAVCTAIVVAGAAAAAWLSAATEFGWFVSGDTARWGQFGDYMGGLMNPTIALAALVVLYRGTAYQKQELESTRRHFESASRRDEIYRLIQTADSEVADLLASELHWVDSRLKGHRSGLEMFLAEGYLEDVDIPLVVRHPAAGVDLAYFLRDRLEPALDQLLDLVSSYESIDGATGAVKRFYFARYARIRATMATVIRQEAEQYGGTNRAEPKEADSQ